MCSNAGVSDVIVAAIGKSRQPHEQESLWKTNQTPAEAQVDLIMWYMWYTFLNQACHRSLIAVVLFDTMFFPGIYHPPFLILWNRVSQWNWSSPYWPYWPQEDVRIQTQDLMFAQQMHLPFEPLSSHKHKWFIFKQKVWWSINKLWRDRYERKGKVNWF